MIVSWLVRSSGGRRVTPALVVGGAAKALELYAEVFGATERTRVPGPGGTTAHVITLRPAGRASAPL